MVAAIESIRSIHRSNGIIERNSYFLNQLTDEKLLAQLISTFETSKKFEWPNFLDGLLGDKLDKIGDRQIIIELQGRIAKLPTSGKFTRVMRASVVKYISEYLAKKVL